MNKLIFVATVIALFSYSGTPSSAQEQTPGQEKPRSICEEGGHFRDFDFWLGEWDVYTNDDERSFQGSNSITRQHNNCLLMENWTSANGNTGSSMNYYDVVEDQWRQLWIANGYSIDYTGGLDDSGSMVLKGSINYYKTSKSQPFKGTWTPNPDGTIRQLFEQFDTESQQWTTWFDGLYVRKQKAG